MTCSFILHPEEIDVHLEKMHMFWIMKCLNESLYVKMLHTWRIWSFETTRNKNKYCFLQPNVHSLILKASGQNLGFIFRPFLDYSVKLSMNYFSCVSMKNKSILHPDPSSRSVFLVLLLVFVWNNEKCISWTLQKVLISYRSCQTSKRNADFNSFFLFFNSESPQRGLYEDEEDTSHRNHRSGRRSCCRPLSGELWLWRSFPVKPICWIQKPSVRFLWD